MTRRLKVDGGITSGRARWKFDAQVAAGFDEHVRKSVPLYDEVQRMVAEMSDWFVIRDGAVVYDLGTATGRTIEALARHHTGKRVRFVGVDESVDMLGRAARRLRGIDGVQLVRADLNAPLVVRDASVVVSLYTVQFVLPENRPALFRAVRDGLREGGAFVFVEKVLGADARFDEMWLELYWDMKRRNGLDDREVVSKAASLRGVLVPYGAERNEALLRDAGFSQIDCFFRWYNFAGWLAIK